jgi:hypothetical protein
MGAENPKGIVRTLQQLAQMFRGKQALKEIDGQIDSFIRTNNLLISDFEARIHALDPSTYSSTSLPKFRWTRLIRNCNELNARLNKLRNSIKCQQLDEALQMISFDLWPLVLKITCSLAEETGSPGSSINELANLFATVERYAGLSTSNRVYAFGKEHTQRDTITVIVTEPAKTEGDSMESTLDITRQTQSRLNALLYAHMRHCKWCLQN